MATDLNEVYQAATLEEAERQLTRFEETWARTYPVIAKSWRANWARVVPMLGYPSEIRRAVYTTNTMFKLMYPALRNISRRWTMPIPNWSGAMNQFAILFDGRVPMNGLNQNSLAQTA